MNGGGFLGGSFKIGRVWGIDVKIHFLFVLWIAMDLMGQTQNIVPALIGQGVLFGSVFLHELGHCWGARLMGGDAKEVILWPLGGLARLTYPPSAKAEFVSTVAGPAVNLLLFVLGLVLGIVALGLEASPGSPAQATGLTLLVWYLALMNLMLFLFNILPAYPMDGGRILRSILWWIPGIGWRTATLIATVTAMVFGAGFVLVSVLLGGSGTLILALIGVMVVVTSYQEFQRAKAHRSLPDLDDDRMGHER